MTTQLTKFDKRPDGTICAEWSNGRGRIFNSLDDLKDSLRIIDTNQDNVDLMSLAYAMARSADLSNVNSVLNKTFTFDLSLAQPIRVQ